jgi:hypothetical protein
MGTCYVARHPAVEYTIQVGSGPFDAHKVSARLSDELLPASIKLAAQRSRFSLRSQVVQTPNLCGGLLGGGVLGLAPVFRIQARLCGDAT